MESDSRVASGVWRCVTRVQREKKFKIGDLKLETNTGQQETGFETRYFSGISPG